jgi:hypothetical protein
VRVWDRWVDRFAGSDPGLNRFRMALQSVQMAGILGLAITDYDTEPAGPASSGGIRVRGRVRTTDGAGVGFATLTLIDPRGRQAAHAVAGADGAYWLDTPAAGAYVLLASAGSHRPAASTVIVRETANGSGTVVNVVLADTSGLAGTVPAADGGYPVPGSTHDADGRR